MLDIATVVASVGGRASRNLDGYDAFAQHFLRAYASVTPLPSSLRAFDAYLVLRQMVSLNFTLHSRNPTVAAWAPQATAGILSALDAYGAGKTPQGMPSDDALAVAESPSDEVRSL